jgi:hypothetical protein
MIATLVHEDRAAFKRCRRAWDLGARPRRNLEPLAAADPFDADRALRDALAVYYFPGMWDWSPEVVVPLVNQALDKAVGQQMARLGPEPVDGTDALIGATGQLLEAYVGWAPGVERLAPVLIEVDFQADLADPDHPDAGLFTAAGEHVRYQGRIDLVGVDQFDAYWIVRHHVVKEWTPLDALVRDEEALAACWAWEQFYIGMEIAGTVHNEMRLPTRSESEPMPPGAPTPLTGRGAVAQHEGSGGGRSVPQHRRLYAQAREPAVLERMERDDGPWFRRTWVRRTREEVAQAGRQLATEARQMFDPGVAVYPSPSPACRRCAFDAPCQALYEGRESEADAILRSSYRPRGHGDVVGRLGGVTWSVGRGAAPPQFSGPQ